MKYGNCLDFQERRATWVFLLDNLQNGRSQEEAAGLQSQHLPVPSGSLSMISGTPTGSLSGCQAMPWGQAAVKILGDKKH